MTTTLLLPSRPADGTGSGGGEAGSRSDGAGRALRDLYVWRAEE